LHAAEDLSFQDGNQGEDGEKNSEQSANVYQARNDLYDPIRRSGQEREEPLFRTDEDLVDGIDHPR
jgi:hypothetical protein